MKNREYVNDFSTPGAAATTTIIALPINPGNITVFQWLASLALCFERYHFKSLAFVWETESPTSQGGKVVLAWDPNVADPQPSNKQQLLAFNHKADDAPWRSFRLPIPEGIIHGLTRDFFVRDTLLPFSADQKLYDCGQLFVGLVGVDNTVSTGELHVEYEVEFLEPTQPPLAADLSARIDGGGALTPANFMGTGPQLLRAGSSLAFIKNNLTVGASEFDFLIPGQYALTFLVTGSGLGAVSIANRNIRVGPANNGLPEFQITNAAGTVTAFMYIVAVDSIKFSVASLLSLNLAGTTVTGSECWIGPLFYASA